MIRRANPRAQESSGLMAGWKKPRHKPPRVNLNEIKSVTPCPPTIVCNASASSTENDTAFGPGGIPSDDDGVERHALDNSKTRKHPQVSPSRFGDSHVILMGLS